MPEQVERRPGHDRHELGRRQLLGRMRNHDLVSDGSDDNPGHQHDVQVGEAVTRQGGAGGGALEAPLRDRGDVAEVQPPHRRGREERDAEGGHPHPVQRQLSRGRAGDHDRLAERDDHEQLEALRKVGGLDLPGRRVEPGSAGDAVEDERGEVVEAERDEPESDPGGARGERSPDPEDPRGDEPREDVGRRPALRRATAGDDERQERVPADLDCDVRAGEEQRPAPERLRNRHGQHEAQEHEREHEEPHHDRVRVEHVRHPGRVVPRPPHDEQDEQRLRRAAPGQVGQQQVGHLRDREHEDEVVEQLQVRCVLLLVGRGVAEVAAHSGGR